MRFRFINTNSFPLPSLFVTALLTMVLVGCGTGEPTAVVTGTVKLDGAPVGKDVVVTFALPAKNFIAFDKTDSAGQYKIAATHSGKKSNRIPVGKYNVVIHSRDVTDDDSNAALGITTATSVGAAIPVRYQDVNTSGLSFEVKSGANAFDLELTNDQ